MRTIWTGPKSDDVSLEEMHRRETQRRERPYEE